MAERHKMALKASEITGLSELADLLKAAAAECISEGKPPFNDAAVRLICFQIAFAGNGDVTFHEYYSDVYDFCALTVQQAGLGFPIREKEKAHEPIYKPS